MAYGNHVLKTWSSTQTVVALSSGEAELYALTKVCAQVIGVMQMAKDFGMTLDACIHSDSTAAIGIVHRSGLGRTRHIQVQYLWLQERVKEKELIVNKVGTKENTADLLTKHLSRDIINVHMEWLNMRLYKGRSIATPALKLLNKKKQ